MFVKITKTGGKDLSVDGVTIAHYEEGETYDLPEWHGKKLVAAKEGQVATAEDLKQIAAAIALPAENQNPAVATGEAKPSKDAGTPVNEPASGAASGAGTATAPAVTPAPAASETKARTVKADADNTKD